MNNVNLSAFITTIITIIESFTVTFIIRNANAIIKIIAVSPSFALIFINIIIIIVIIASARLTFTMSILAIIEKN